MTKTAYSHSLRMLLCARCGAPLDAPTEGGVTTCRYCGTQSTLARRDDSREVAAVRQTMSEPERFERLRAQDGKPLVPPQSLMHYLAGGGLAPQFVEQALVEWQRARAELGAGAPYPTEERLYFLTLLLAQHWGEQHDDYRQRGILETALELVSVPRHKQVFRCMLARNAARVGDLQAAEAWLKPCNPWSDDLHMDTAYRFARAYIATLQHDFQNALGMLGTRLGDVPIADSHDDVCALFRANALERLGRGPEAVGELRASMTTPQAVAAMDRARTIHGALQLCPQSYPQARAQLTPMMVQRPGASAGPGCGTYIWLVIGIGSLVVGGLAFAASRGWISASMVPMFGMLPGMGLEIVAMVFGFNGLIFTGLGVVFLVSGARKRRLRETGLPGRAQVLSAEGTGVLVNGQPMLSFELMVTVAGQVPYQLRHREVVSQMTMGRVHQGGSVAVRVDPKDPRRLMIDWSEP